jgi:hypothetical protein
MQSFREFRGELQIFERQEVEHLNEAEVKEAERIYTEISDMLKERGIEDLDEGFLSSIIGGIAGFVVGPAVGKVIANALGIERGILFDMLTSRLVGTALGASLTSYIGGK